MVLLKFSTTMDRVELERKLQASLLRMPFAHNITRASACIYVIIQTRGDL